MAIFTDELMKQLLTQSRNYTLVILKSGRNYNRPEAKSVIWEHGRRNFELRAEGILSIVCPVTDTSEVRGIGIFNGEQEKIKEIMDQDPGVKEGVFTYEIHPCRSFPGDRLP